MHTCIMYKIKGKDDPIRFTADMTQLSRTESLYFLSSND